MKHSIEHEEKSIRKVYFSVRSPAFLSSPLNVWLALDKTIPLSVVKKVLNGFEIEKLHSEKKIGKRNKTVPISWRTDFQADLAIMDKFASQNKGFRLALWNLSLCLKIDISFRFPGTS